MPAVAMPSLPAMQGFSGLMNSRIEAADIQKGLLRAETTYHRACERSGAIYVVRDTQVWETGYINEEILMLTGNHAGRLGMLQYHHSITGERMMMMGSFSFNAAALESHLKDQHELMRGIQSTNRRAQRRPLAAGRIIAIRQRLKGRQCNVISPYFADAQPGSRRFDDAFKSASARSEQMVRQKSVGESLTLKMKQKSVYHERHLDEAIAYLFAAGKVLGS